MTGRMGGKGGPRGVGSTFFGPGLKVEGGGWGGVTRGEVGVRVGGGVGGGGVGGGGGCGGWLGEVGCGWGG
jgi:hypothetical protein